MAARAHSNPSSQQQGSRREALLATAAAAALVLAPGNAQAFLGIGEDINKIYTEETVRCRTLPNFLLRFIITHQLIARAQAALTLSWQRVCKRRTALLCAEQAPGEDQQGARDES